MKVGNKIIEFLHDKNVFHGIEFTCMKYALELRYFGAFPYFNISIFKVKDVKKLLP